jgi:zinc transport system substrate-binding protein
MNRKVTVLLAIIVLVALTAIILLKQSSRPLDQSFGKIKVVTSFYPLFFFASQIGQDKADVFNITPAGAEPHDYEPTAQEVARIENSQLLILNGGVEAWGDKIKADLKAKNIPIIQAGEGLVNKDVKEGSALADPHVWLDPKLAKIEAQKIVDAFITIDPQNKEYYLKNSQNLNQQLDSLDGLFRQGLAACKKQDIVTSHAAFGYLATAYGFHQIAISGLSPDAEPSTQKLAEVADFVKKNSIKYIFFESLVSPKFSDTIAQETGAQTLVLDPLEGIPDNELAKGSTYLSVMKNNLANLQIALECAQ